MKRIKYILLILLLAGCTKTIYVPQTRTEYVNRERVDSLFIHDSVFVREYVKGDTVFRDRDRWHTEYRDREIHDTLVVHDSIPYPVPSPPEIVYKTPGFVRWLAWIGGIAIAVCGFILSCKLAKRL